MNKIEIELEKVHDYLIENVSTEISLSSIEDQLKLFYFGVKVPALAKPCTIGDGIHRLSDDETYELLTLHSEAARAGRIIKFVPASGAASRMFHKLQSVLNRFKNFRLSEIESEISVDKECKSVHEFLTNLKKFAFYDDLKNVLNVDDPDIDKLIHETPAEILKAVLSDKGLNYSFKPKGAIKFHKYRIENRTAFDEQIYESLKYLIDFNNKVRIHFTISEEHKNLFVEIAEKIKSDMKYHYNLDLTFSYQKKSTDTIAVNVNNEVLFDVNKKLMLRPAGHGALLENLNDLNADIVIIKNIDNLSTDNLSAATILYKKLLTGYLVKTQNQIFELLNSLDRKDFSKKSFDEMIKFAEDKFSITKPADFKNWTEETKHKFLFDKLNRPIRVCGMVKNADEPGGGPFWIKNEDGSLSLQIVEQAQINLNDENQKNIFKQSTHFNPVDLVCGLKDYKGNNFNLHNFVDHQSGIITKKSKDGVELKALELPGLWNGSMADWITIFIEVPITTFNPVKEVNDLLRREHQN
jgi:hypothetical protein